MDEYYQAIQQLPPALSAALAQLPPELACHVQEIHLRSGRPVVLTAGASSFVLPQTGPAQVIGHRELQACYQALCGYSVHSHQRDLCQGYFTLPGGHRVGVAGLPVYREGKIHAYQTLLSLNLRVARARAGLLPPELLRFLAQGQRGLLLIGPPGSGKTTLLRAVAQALSQQKKKTCVIDSRGELFPGGPQGYQTPPPLHCDVLEGYERADGILIALRTLGPEYILCDELGAQEDTDAVLAGLHTGVCFVATLHGASLQQAARRPPCQRLLQSGAFGGLVCLKGAQEPGVIGEVQLL